MNINRDFHRLKLLDEAQEQFERLRSLNNLLKYQPMSQEQQKQCLMFKEKASNLICLYKNVLSLYTSQIVNEKDRETENVSYRRSHSRSKLSVTQASIKKNEINTTLINQTLCCTIAYIHTNFLGLFEQAGMILLKSKDDLSQFMQKILNEKSSISKRSGRISQLSNFGMKQRQSNRKDEQLSERSSMSLSKFYNKPTYSNNTNKQNTLQPHHQLYLSYIRICMNLVINLILQNRHTFAVEIFNQMVQFIDKIEDQKNQQKIISYIFKVWFNINNQQFPTWKDKIKSFRKNLDIVIQGRLTLQEAVSLSHFIFNSDLFSPQQDSVQQDYPVHYIKILQKSIETFLQNSLFELAFFTLRHLLQSPVSPQLKQKYYIQLREMLQSGKLPEDIELQNIESVECFRSIITTLNSLSQKYQCHNKSHDESQIQSKTHLFNLIVKIQISKIIQNSQLTQTHKDFLIQKLTAMKNQTKIEIIESMLQQKSAQNIIKDTKQKIDKIFNFSKHHLTNHFNTFVTCLKSYKYIKPQFLPLSQKCMNNSNLLENRSQSKLKMISPSHSRRYLKVISTSILTDNPSIHPSTCQKHKIFEESSISTCSNDHKKLSKMIRLCEYGGFLNKRNFNSDGGEFKFIKITIDKIKWSKNPQKIDESSHSYPLKDIKGIIYGKVSPNFKKSCNKGLKQELCFSLILQKRTMDFYCKDYKEVQSWVCGISAILKKQNPQIAGYTPGKMRWKKMFAVLRQAFIQPLKIHERNQFYFENAYSLILLRKNGYKLPSSQRIL